MTVYLTTDPADVIVSPARSNTPSVDLYWIPLGAGAHVVRISGKIFEALVKKTESPGGMGSPFAEISDEDIDNLFSE